VQAVKRRAKVLIIELSSEYSLVIHLKMTGQLVFRGEQSFGAGHPNASLVGDLPDKSTRVTLTFQDDSKLFFNDQRKFGWMRLLPTVEVPAIDFFQKVGPEPLDAAFTANDCTARLRHRSRSAIKAVLLDQTVVAGIGNIYADESLWAAKIHPLTRVEQLSDAQLGKLYDGLIAVLKLSIEKGGSTDRNYVDAEGKRGSYLTFANVFRREGKPCPRCGTTIIKIRAAGRGTHLCPHCQKIPKETAT
jgi:formamidopyrimidine-DNA glycosylase